jgi:hypothetical protein
MHASSYEKDAYQRQQARLAGGQAAWAVGAARRVPFASNRLAGYVSGASQFSVGARRQRGKIHYFSLSFPIAPGAETDARRVVAHFSKRQTKSEGTPA